MASRHADEESRRLQDPLRLAHERGIKVMALAGAVNVVPGEARHSLDLRHPNDDERERVRDRLQDRAKEIAASRGCENRWEVRQETDAVPADRKLSSLLAQAVEDSGLKPYRLPSGAGHDAAQVATLAPVAMLFVRCKGGISHNPAESVTREDVEVALRVIRKFLRLLEREGAALEDRDLEQTDETLNRDGP